MSRREDYIIYFEGYAYIICGQCDHSRLYCHCKRKRGEKK